jgi:hypothetical protein
MEHPLVDTPRSPAIDNAKADVAGNGSMTVITALQRVVVSAVNRAARS